MAMNWRTISQAIDKAPVEKLWKVLLLAGSAVAVIGIVLAAIKTVERIASSETDTIAQIRVVEDRVTRAGTGLEARIDILSQEVEQLYKASGITSEQVTLVTDLLSAVEDKDKATVSALLKYINARDGGIVIRGHLTIEDGQGKPLVRIESRPEPTLRVLTPVLQIGADGAVESRVVVDSHLKVTHQ